MADIAETKARLLAKYAKQALEEHDKKNALDLTPIIAYLNKSLSYVSKSIPINILTARDMKIAISSLEQKEALENLIERVDVFQNPRHPGPPMNIHILSIYLFPDLYDYAAKYEPTTDCGVSPVYDAIGKVLCNWTGHEYYGEK